jgi:beta-glucanase (GH16 family)
MRNIVVLHLLIFTEAFPQGYTLVWSDEFNGTTLDQTKWSYETGNNGGWGNSELEYYTDRTENCNVQDSCLTITASNESYSGYSYTSARIKTQDKFSFQYGKIEARMKLPYGKGLWPAFWLIGDNISSVGWPACGESDIMEMIGGSGTGSTGNPVSDSKVYGTLHWSQNGSEASAGGNYSLSAGRFADEFHLFGMIWTSKTVELYVDNTVYYQIDISPTALSAFQNKFFVIFNLAVGGNWPGNPDGTTVFPQTMQIDYVRVYQDTTQSPTVSLTSPQNNSTFGPNSDITIAADATIQSGTISKVDFFQGAMKIGETFVSPYQMEWKNVFPGNYKLTGVAYSNNGSSVVSDTVTVAVGSGAATSPYGGTPAQVPGTIEAENYDLGGQGEAYYDTDLQNTGGQYRPDDGVDIEACSDSGGGYDVGWIQAGEWMLYTVDVTDSGTYQIGARVSSTSTSGSLHFEVDGTDVTGIMNVPNTGGWQSWATVESQTFTLSAGIHQIKLVVNSAGFDVNKFYVYPPDAGPSLNLLYPDGGEKFAADSIVEITWKSQMVDQVRIGFSTNGGGFYSLVQTGVDAGFGVYRLKVPSVSSSSCKVIVMDQDITSVMDTSASVFSVGMPNSVSEKNNFPRNVFLSQNYPNPFNPSTTISYQLSSDCYATLRVYDVLGREAASLVNGRQTAGLHTATFYAGDLPSGVYLYRLDAAGFTQVKKMILMK